MAAPLPFSESELSSLQILLRRNVRFMVVGLSAATLQGARPECDQLPEIFCGLELVVRQ